MLTITTDIPGEGEGEVTIKNSSDEGVRSTPWFGLSELPKSHQTVVRSSPASKTWRRRKQVRVNVFEWPRQKVISTLASDSVKEKISKVSKIHTEALKVVEEETGFDKRMYLDLLSSELQDLERMILDELSAVGADISEYPSRIRASVSSIARKYPSSIQDEVDSIAAGPYLFYLRSFKK